MEGRFSAKLNQTSSDTCLDCGRKARCLDGVCYPNYDPDSGCTVCIRPETPPFFYGRNCSVCPAPEVAILLDGLIMVPGLYCILCTLYVVFKTDTSKESKVQVVPGSAEDFSDDEEEGGGGGAADGAADDDDEEKKFKAKIEAEEKKFKETHVVVEHQDDARKGNTSLTGTSMKRVFLMQMVRIFVVDLTARPTSELLDLTQSIFIFIFLLLLLLLLLFDEFSFLLVPAYSN